MKFRLLTILLLCLPLVAQQYSVQYNSTSKRIIAPTNILGMTFGNQLVTNFVGTGLQNSAGNLAVDGSLYNLYLNPNIYQATNGNLTLLQAYGPTTWQATNANLTALAGNPNLYQATNSVLTTLASLGPNTWQATNAALTALANNPQLYQATNGTLTRLGGIGAGVSGDVLYRDATGWTNLAKGIDGKVLKLTGGFPSWETDSTGVGATGDDVWVNHQDVTNPNFTNHTSAEITWGFSGTNVYPELASTVTRDAEVSTWITVSTNLVPNLSLVSFAGQDQVLTNSFLMSAMTASRLAIFDGSKYLTNSTLTEASITDNLTEAEASALYEATNNPAINRIKNLPTTSNYLLFTDGTGITNKAVGGDLTFVLGDFTIAANSVALTTDTTGDYVATAAGTAAEVEVTGAGTEGRAITIGLPDDLALGDASFTSITNSALTASQFVSAAADKSLTSAAVASSILAASLTDETGTGSAVFSNLPTFSQGSTAGGGAYFIEDSDNGTSKITLKSADALAADYTVTLPSATGTLGLNAKVREIWIPANAMNAPASGAPAFWTNTWATTTDGQAVEVYRFDSASDEQLQFTLTLPGLWDGADPKAKIYWKQQTASTKTNIWGIVGGSLADGDTGGNTLGTAATLDVVGLNDTNKVDITAAITVDIGSTPTAGDLIWFKVYRDADAANDDMSDDAYLIGIMLQYTELATEPTAW